MVGHLERTEAREERSWARLGRAYRSGDAVWAVLLAVVGTVALVAALELQIAQAHDPLGGRFFPVAISATLIVAALAVLVRPAIRVLRGRDPGMGPRTDTSPQAGVEADAAGAASTAVRTPLGRVAAMAVVSFTYIVLLYLIGYIPATILGMAGALRVLGTRRLRSLLVGPVIISVGLYLIFTNLLYVRLP